MLMSALSFGSLVLGLLLGIFVLLPKYKLARSDRASKKAVSAFARYQIDWFKEFNNDLPKSMQLRLWRAPERTHAELAASVMCLYPYLPLSAYDPHKSIPADLVEDSLTGSYKLLTLISLRVAALNTLIHFSTLPIIPHSSPHFSLHIQQQNIPGIGEKYAVLLSNILVACFVCERKPSEALRDDPSWCLKMANLDWSQRGFAVPTSKLTKSALTTFRLWYLG